MELSHVFAEVFQCRYAVSYFLYLVEKQHCLAWNDTTFVVLLQLVDYAFDIEVRKQRRGKGVIMAVYIFFIYYLILRAKLLKINGICKLFTVL